MVNELDVMTNTFEMKVSPQLSVLDIATYESSLGKSTLISLFTLVNHQTKRQQQRDKPVLRRTTVYVQYLTAQ